VSGVVVLYYVPDALHLGAHGLDHISGRLVPLRPVLVVVLEEAKVLVLGDYVQEDLGSLEVVAECRVCFAKAQRGLGRLQTRLGLLQVLGQGYGRIEGRLGSGDEVLDVRERSIVGVSWGISGIPTSTATATATAIARISPAVSFGRGIVGGRGGVEPGRERGHIRLLG